MATGDFKHPIVQLAPKLLSSDPEGSLRSWQLLPSSSDFRGLLRRLPERPRPLPPGLKMGAASASNRPVSPPKEKTKKLAASSGGAYVD